MRKDLLAASWKDRLRFVEMDQAIIRSLDRVIGQLVQNTWRQLTAEIKPAQDHLDYSGIFPLGAHQLDPFLDRPGLVLAFGPLPEVPILHLGASRAAVRETLSSRLIPGPEFSWGGARDSDRACVPSFAACASMTEDLNLVPAMKTLLAQYLAPLRSIYTDAAERSVFS